MKNAERRTSRSTYNQTSTLLREYKSSQIVKKLPGTCIYWSTNVFFYFFYCTLFEYIAYSFKRMFYERKFMNYDRIVQFLKQYVRFLNMWVLLLNFTCRNTFVFNELLVNCVKYSAIILKNPLPIEMGQGHQGRECKLNWYKLFGVSITSVRFRNKYTSNLLSSHNN